MSNLLVVLLLCAILKALKPELGTEPVYLVAFISAAIDTTRLITWWQRGDK